MAARSGRRRGSRQSDATRTRKTAKPSSSRRSTAVFRFNRAWMSAVMPYLDDGGLLATFIDWRSVDLVIASGLALELALLNLVVWEKSNGGQGSLWRSQHELLPVFKKGVAPHVNNVELGRHGRWRPALSPARAAQRALRQR